MLIPVIVTCNKFDVFASTYESIKKKQLCLALRYICHSNGCDLVFTSVREKVPGQLFKIMLTRHVFSDPTLMVKVDKDPN